MNKLFLFLTISLCACNSGVIVSEDDQNTSNQGGKNSKDTQYHENSPEEEIENENVTEKIKLKSNFTNPPSKDSVAIECVGKFSTDTIDLIDPTLNKSEVENVKFIYLIDQQANRIFQYDEDEQNFGDRCRGVDCEVKITDNEVKWSYSPRSSSRQTSEGVVIDVAIESQTINRMSGKANEVLMYRSSLNGRNTSKTVLEWSFNSCRKIEWPPIKTRKKAKF